MDTAVHFIVLSLAWFAALNLLASATAILWAAVLLRRHRSVPPRLVLFVRLLPSVVSIAFVIAIFLPVQWALEPRNTAETVGLVWFVLAAIGGSLIARSFWRAVRIAGLSRILRRRARPWSVSSDIDEVDELPGVSLAGVLSPRILVGRRVRRELTAAELEVAIAHERAHCDARDNLARWGMLCAPDFLHGSRVSRRLERRWHVAAESRADARAVCGDRVRAIHLASALIKVARLSAAWSETTPAIVGWSTLNDSDLLEWRVGRLVNDAPPIAEPRATWGTQAVIALVAIIAALPFLAGPIHRLTEALVAVIP